MRKSLQQIFFLTFLSGSIMLLFYACSNKIEIDTPQVVSYTVGESAYMADSIPLAIAIDGKYDMNSVRILFFINDEKISETMIPTNKAGSFATKLYVPYAKDVADGTAELQIVPRNKNFNYSVKTIPIKIVRPKFPFLILKTAYGDYQMDPVPGESYKYSVTSNFPTRSLNALIEAPAYSDNGNAFYFGGKTIVANAYETDSIPFKADPSLGASYTVSFDTRTFEAEPFLKPAFGGNEFPAFVSDMTVIEKDFTQDQAIAINGIADISDWWIDPTFLDKVGSEYKFRAISGKYRVTADQNLKYFRIEPMNGNALADFDPVTKTGGVWINGGVGDQPGTALAGRLGIPSITTNPSLWGADKNIAMAPKGNGVFEVKLVANQTLFLSNVSGSTAGISFYQNSRSKDNAFALNLVQSLYGNPGSPSTSGGSARFELKPASADSNGQMICTGSNRSLGNGRTYVFSIDTKSTPAKISISLE